MRKINIFIYFIISICAFQIHAQDYTELWKGHYCYLDIKDVSQSGDKIYGAAENAIFSYNSVTEEMENLSTVNGLSGEAISTIKYIDDKGLLLVGFENGLIQVYDELTGEFLSVVDVLGKPSIPPNDKKINHFEVYNGYAYISTGFGISLYDLDTLEFGDTYIIGNGGSNVNVNQITISDNFIYAATTAGIKKADVNNSNLIDFNQWLEIDTANWIGIASVNNKLFASKSDNGLYSVIDDVISQIVVFSNFILDTRVSNEKLIITTNNEVNVYNPEDLSVLANITTEKNIIDYTAATVGKDNNLYISTKGIVKQGKQGYGVLKTVLNDTSILEKIHPESPLANRFFRIGAQAGEVWAVHGGHSKTYNFNGGVRKTGISHYTKEGWNNITYDSLNVSVNKPWDLSYLSINPVNTSQVFISSHYSGLLDVNNQDISLYNEENSSLDLFAIFHLLNASKYDREGALWVMNARTNFALNKFKDNKWTSYSFESLISSAKSNLGFSSITFDNDNNIFIGSSSYGIIGYNPENKTIVNVTEEDNMPSNYVTSVKVDNQGQLWIGTDGGLRVMYNTSEFMEGNGEVSDIIILDDGEARELLFKQFITDIEVDGSNNKWIATLDTGVYYFSSDGQNTIYHFTKDNSPLPTNNVQDIALDESSGKVYFATEKGMVAFSSGNSAPVSDLEEAYAYPNPVRPNFKINEDKVKIKGITGNVNIKITDVEGNLVAEAESRTNTKFKGYNLEIDGGTALWNGQNMSNVTVATGVYLVFISDLDTFETKTLKVMVVR